ncbi:MAG: hypothetical protein LBB81_01295 [Treponema sp.]|jgi:hypothetical protein|nr:hypothetical protein [Treponema sp.]
MSDFFEQLENTRKAAAPMPYDPDRNRELFERAGHEFIKERQAAVSVHNALNMNLNTESYNFLMRGIDSGAIDEEELFKMATSLNIADRYNLPVAHVRENLPSYLAGEGIDPDAKMSQTVLRTVLNKLEIGASTPRLGNLKYELMEAESADGDSEHAKKIRAEIERIEAKNQSLEDVIPDNTRTWRDRAKRLLGSSAQTIGYSAYVGAHNFFGKAAGLGIVDLGPLFAWDAGRKIEAGDEYYALRSAGIDPDIARPLSEAHGAVSSGIEQALEKLLGMGMGGLAAKLGKTTTKTVTEELASNVFKTLQHNGFLYKMAEAMTGWALNIPQEFSEEFLQEGDGLLFEAIAKALQQNRWDGQIAEIRNGRPDAELSEDDLRAINTLAELKEKLTQKTFRESLGQMWKAGIEGGTAAIALALPGAVGQTGIGAIDVRRARQIAEVTSSKEQYRRYTEDLSIYKNLDAETRTAAQDKVWENMRGKREAAETARAEELKNRRLYGAIDTSGEVYRNEENGLHMEVVRSMESGGLETFEFAAGDPRKSEKNSYAVGKGEIRGDKFVIDEFKIGEKYEGLRGEILQNLANDTGRSFDFEGQAYAPNGEGRSMRFGWAGNTAPVRQEFDFNRKYYGEPDTRADIAAKKEFARSLLSLDTRLDGEAAANTVVDFYDIVGRKWFGTGFDAFMKRLTGNNVGGLLTQELGDEQVARWVAKNEGLAADAGAVSRIQQNLTDAQREEARRNIHGFTAPGADGITKAIYAARDADVSTFVHEGIHAFTQLAKATDTELYRRMMDAAGFDRKAYDTADSTSKERMTREAMETLAYGAEAYLKNGPNSVSNSTLRNLYERLKEFLKDLADAARKAEYLTPEVQALFDGLFGDNAGQASESTVNATKGNDTAYTGDTAPEGVRAQPEANWKAAEEEFEIYSDNFDRDIKDKNIPVGKRSEAAVKKAVQEYGDSRLDRRDRGHRPTAELIKRVMNIQDAAERARVTADIRELRKAYAGTAAEFKAPNGKESLLLSNLGEEKGKEAWYAVRTKNFKEWFGDWESAAKIAEMEKNLNEYTDAFEKAGKQDSKTLFAKYDNTPRPIAFIPQEYLRYFKKETADNRIYTGLAYFLDHAINHHPDITLDDYRNIQKILNDADEVIRDDRPDEKNGKPRDNLLFIKDIGKNLVLVVTLEEDNNGRILLHKSLYKGKKNPYPNLTRIRSMSEGGVSSISHADQTAPGGSLSARDNNIIGYFTQPVNPEAVSKIVDENGEPLAVFRGDKSGKDRFINRQGVYTAGEKSVAKDYSSGGLYDLFLNMKKPLALDERSFSETRERINDILYDLQEMDWSELKNSEQFLRLRDNYLAFRNDEGSRVRDFYNDFLPEVSEDTDIEEFRDVLVQSVHDANTFEWRQIDFRDIDILNPYIKTMGYDGIVRPYDPLGQARGEEYVTFEPAQVKSATENAGTFSAGTDSIYYQEAFQGSPYWFDRHNNSYVGSGFGNLRHGWGHYLYGRKEAAEWFKQAVSKIKGVEGQLYNVEIPGDNELLHWDKPVSEQPDVVRQAADKLISWNKNGVSNFNEAYNLRKFNDGGYGFLRSINGKAKWKTIEEAQTAATSEIKKTLTGKEFYNALAESIGAKETSLLLDYMGIKGTKYFDRSTEKIGVPKAYNYVIYGDSDINITRTFYSEAFRDAEFSGFINDHTEVVKEAAKFESGAEMAEYYAENNGEKSGLNKEAEQKFFNTLVEGAKEIHPDKSIEELEAELAGEPRTAKAFVDMTRTEKGFDELVRGVYAVLRDGPEQGYSGEETRKNQIIHDRVRHAFNPEGNGNWKVALADIAAGRRVNEHTKKIIQGMIRNRPLQYMEAWAMMKGDDTWLPGETDVQRIRRLDTEGLVDEEYLEKQSPEELERIGRRLADDRIRKKIKDGTLKMDDPELDDYERQLREDVTEARKRLDEKKEYLGDYEVMLRRAEENARKEQIILEQKKLDTSEEGLRETKKQRDKLEKTQRETRELIIEMDQWMNNKLSMLEKKNFMEFRKLLREQEERQAELKAIEEIREIKKRDLRQILRSPDKKTVNVAEARLIEWVQAHFDSYAAIARYVGKGAKSIQQLYNEFATSGEYREKLKKKLDPLSYHVIERIVFMDIAGKEVRAYGEIDARRRRILYKYLTGFQGIFEKMGIDVTAELREFNARDWAALRDEIADVMPANILAKLEGLLDEDDNHNRRVRVDDFTLEDMQTLAGVVNRLRKEGREKKQARMEARAQLREEAQGKITATLEANMPKHAAGDRTKGIASTKLEEEERSGKKSVRFMLHNARRFFRTLEGGKDGYLHDFITAREYDAFDAENRHVFERRENVERQLKENGIIIKDLYRNTFRLWNGDTATLDEMLSFYYAQYNERAMRAVIFGDFATSREREALRAMADNADIDGQMKLEAEIAGRYWSDLKKLDEFFSRPGNENFRKVMDIIGRDYEDNYGRLKDFVAREYNEELGSEPYYMPLQRLEIAAQENTEVEQALADAGLSRYINKGFTKGRVDIPSWGQQPVKAGFYSTWDQMVVRQEHLMAYDPLMRELKQIFEGRGSETLRDTLRRGHSDAAVKYARSFISELGTPPVQEDLAALDRINRLVRGHYAAAVLGWRMASILKQAIESPPPFLQFVTPKQYAAAGISCLRKETRDMVYEKSVYMKARYADPAMAVVHQMEKMYLPGKLGKAEEVFAKIEKTGMKGQEWIDAVCVLPGWLAAYRKELGELNRSEPNLSVEEADARAVRYADQVMRDCQPSSVLMDQVPLLKGNKHPLVRMFMQFQTPVASIYQQLFIDAPANFKQGRIAHGLWTWGIYALLAVVIGAMHDDDDDEKLNLKNRAVDALVMPLEMIPVIGGDLSYATESFIRDGKIRPPRRSYFPIADQGIRVVNAISDEQWEKAAEATVKGFAYYIGLPVAAEEDIEKAVKTGKWQRVLGIK